MQFGKIHGVALVVLGVVLLCIQAMLYLTPKEVSSGAIETSITETEHKTHPLAGILGGIEFDLNDAQDGSLSGCGQLFILV